MLISALFAGIIPLLMWMYQKATDTESPENEKLNITIFGVLFGYLLMDEIITWRVLISLIIIMIGIYIVKRNNKGIDR